VSAAVLRPGLLAGRRFAFVGEEPPAGLTALGADVIALDADPAEEDAMGVAAGDVPGADGVVVDAAALFTGAGGGPVAVQGMLDRTWNAVRAVALAAWIGPGRPGTILLVGPRPGGPGTEAARAGLENLARTLSIEWARHGIRPVALLPGPQTTDAEVAELGGFVLSPAGAYFSGTALVTA
jgi:hypothetical protein